MGLVARGTRIMCDNGKVGAKDMEPPRQLLGTQYKRPSRLNRTRKQMRIGNKSLKDVELSFEAGKPCCPFCGYVLKRLNDQQMSCVNKQCTMGNKMLRGNFAIWKALFDLVKTSDVILKESRTQRGALMEKMLDTRITTQEAKDSIQEAHSTIVDTINGIYDIIDKLHSSRNKFEYFMAKEGVDYNA